MLKVLVISSYTGAVNAVRPEAELYIGLYNQGFKVTIMTPGDTYYSKRFKEVGMEVIDFAPKSKIDFKAISLIKNTIITGAYQIVHCYNNKAISNTNIAAWNLDVKILTYRGYTGNIYWWDPINYLTHLSPRVDKIVCLADSVKEWFEQHTFVKRSKLIRITKGHSVKWFEETQKVDLTQFGVPQNAIVFGCFANIRRMKGLPYLLKATYLLPKDLPIHLLLVGAKMEDPYFKKLIEQSPYKDRIHLTGWRNDAMNILASCSATVLASIKGEAIPKAVIESMFLAVPPVLTNIPGTRNMVEEGISGIVVKPGDPQDLARGMEMMARLTNQQRAQIGDNARQRAKKIFSIEDTIENYKNLYMSLIQ